METSKSSGRLLGLSIPYGSDRLLIRNSLWCQYGYHGTNVLCGLVRSSKLTLALESLGIETILMADSLVVCQPYERKVQQT